VCLALFSLVNCLVYVILRLTLCQPSVRECQTALIALDLMSCSWLSFVLDHSQTQFSISVLSLWFCCSQTVCVGVWPDSDWQCIDRGEDGRWQRKTKGMLSTVFRKETLCWSTGEQTAEPAKVLCCGFGLEFFNYVYLCF